MITLEMKLAAARTIAGLAPAGELVPDPLTQHVHDAVANAVSEAAAQSGVSRPEFAALQISPGRPEG
jgi:malic enzyme